jgi:hypothetical protein
MVTVSQTRLETAPTLVLRSQDAQNQLEGRQIMWDRYTLQQNRFVTAN